MSILSSFFSNTIVAFTILIGVVVFAHELGHFLAGKLFGIRVEEFSIGFGPRAFGFRKNHTEYRINWLPLGGYVRFFGADPTQELRAQEKQQSLLHASLYKRAIVSFAGPFANFVLSFFVMCLIHMHGVPDQQPIVAVLPQSVAAKSGLETGDRILAIDGKKIQGWSDLVKIISVSPNKTLSVSLEKQHQLKTILITPAMESAETIYGTKESVGRIGITPLPSTPILIKSDSIVDAIQKGFYSFVQQSSLIYTGIKMLISGHVPLSNLGGPIAIAGVAGEAAKAGVLTFFFTLSLISVNIGMVNLLPLPALDGGTLFLCLVEAIYGKPLPLNVQLIVQRIGIVFILSLFIFVFYNDLMRLFHF